ncbi:MAG: hypothetical protein JW704_11550, partial [Anaerolineaceae bacterium]|nr:hypothetical protein [Anaerolineaceae bacterium]
MANKPSTIEPVFRSLFRLGTWAAWFAAGLILAEAILFALHPQPEAIDDWFQLLQGSPVIGLLDAWLLELPLYAAFVLVFLALCILLKQD